jgi:CheY-like chemotaxis protein
VKQASIILLVDDNPADVDLARMALQENLHHIQVESVGDGEQALSFLNRTGIHAEELRPDLVILDLNLPKKDGTTVLAEVKADAGLHTIPIVVFSTSCSMKDIGRSYELGANSYVSKPGNLKDYLAAVQSIEQFWFGSASLPTKGQLN